MREQKTRRRFRLQSIHSTLDHFASIGEPFKIEFTNYSIKVETQDEKYFFSDSPQRLQPLVFYNKIKKEIAGEVRDTPANIKYFDFSGLKKKPPADCVCVDINSAYLSSLLIDGIISESLFNEIDKKSRRNKHAKMDRLKAVGMFARNSVSFTSNGESYSNFETKRGPFAWVFFHACKKTTEAMQAVKKELKKEFLFYWVDGIFLKSGSEHRAVEILQNLGFKCKIEKIHDLRKTEKIIFYKKEKEQKFLFLPRNNSEELSEYRKQIKNSRPC